MSALGKAIVSRLTAAQTADTSDQTDALAILTAKIGPRVYPLISPENIYHLITYQIHGEDEQTVQPLATKEFTVTLTIETKKDAAHPNAYTDLDTIATAVKALLDRKGGTWGTVPVRGFYFKGSEEDSFADEQNAEELFYQVDQEYRVWAQA